MAKKRRRPSNRSFLIAVLVGFAFIVTGIILLMQEIPQPGLPSLVFGMIVAGVAASWWDRLSREESAAREAADEAEAADAGAADAAATEEQEAPATKADAETVDATAVTEQEAPAAVEADVADAPVAEEPAAVAER